MLNREDLARQFERNVVERRDRMNARLAEAEAWREVARWIDSFGHGLYLPWTERFPNLIRSSMADRLCEHHRLAPVELDRPARVLIALCLALECEDEAQEAAV